MNRKPMRTSRHRIAVLILAGTLALVSYGFARTPEKVAANTGKDTTAAPAVHASDTDLMRIQGEKRYRANCGRCHAAPHKFPPRMMATVIRHMRVRATITDEDMRLVLFYMTQ